MNKRLYVFTMLLAVNFVTYSMGRTRYQQLKTAENTLDAIVEARRTDAFKNSRRPQGTPEEEAQRVAHSEKLLTALREAKKELRIISQAADQAPQIGYAASSADASSDGSCIAQ